ncbi:23S rRNA (guanosine(2251)-2'-O)-methyltransferase RlmB [Trichloromonas sp.]|uniref:23S rRNA (guanosine(2251)-2'-O)-methyltransferase RlmB n=1 Tax=Trichloromonas sp. TaxID=3069249 RepID=UPI002A4D647C|nr:23S rRNA (guanosine(2251)-2'-O)-methyltransferase RlmB [Trichloromonas sp.]
MNDVVYGVNPVREALAGERRKPLELFVARDARSPRIDEVLAEAGRRQVPVRRRERKDLDRMAGHGHHQGLVLSIEPFAYVELEDLLNRWRDSGEKAFFLVLDGLTDPHNFGAVLRSAEAAGCHGVITARDRACSITPVVDRAAAGALAHLPLCQVTNIARTLEELKASGCWVFGLAGEEGAQPLFSAELAGDLALVLGGEGSGLRPNVRRHCDGLLSIPMRGALSSLNASVAAGVALFEVVRRRLTAL